MAAIGTIGNEVGFTDGTTTKMYSVMIDSTRVATCFQDYANSYHGKIVIGTIDGTGTTYADDQTFSAVSQTHVRGLCKLDATRYVIAYETLISSTYTTYVVVATLNGSTFSFGTPEQVIGVRVYEGFLITMDSNTFVFAHNYGTYRSLYMKSFTVANGNQITSGATNARFSQSSEYTDQYDAFKVDSSNFVFSYRGSDGTAEIYLTYFSLDGNTVTSAPRVEAASATYNSLSQLDDTHFLVQYILGTTEGISGRIATLNPATGGITLGDAEISGVYTSDDFYTIMLDANTFLFSTRLRDWGNSVWLGVIYIGTVDIDTDTITYDSYTVINDDEDIGWNQTLRISNSKYITVYCDVSESYKGKSIVGTATGTIADNPALLSAYYGLSSVKGNIRGKAKNGFIRPTLRQFFTSADFEEIESNQFYGYTYDLCVGGTATADSIANSNWPAGNAFDDGTARYSSWISNTVAVDHWIKYDFGAGNEQPIEKVAVYAAHRESELLNTPSDFLIQGSTDDSIWETLSTIEDKEWSETLEKAEYILNAERVPYRYIRLYCTDNNSPDPAIVIGEIEMFKGIYRPEDRPEYERYDSCVSGTASADSIVNAHWSAANAFDDGSAQYSSWASDGNITDHWVKYDFGENNDVIIGKVIVYSFVDHTSWHNYTPTSFLIQASTDDISWDTLESVENVTWTYSGEPKTFTLNSSNTSYRYIRFYVVTGDFVGPYTGFGEIEVFARIIY